MNDMMSMIEKFEKKDLPFKHIPGPEGVRGRNSDNALILEQLGWEPTIRLEDGLRITYFWIKKQVGHRAGLASRFRGCAVFVCLKGWGYEVGLGLLEASYEMQELLVMQPS